MHDDDPRQWPYMHQTVVTSDDTPGPAGHYLPPESAGAAISPGDSRFDPRTADDPTPERDGAHLGGAGDPTTVHYGVSVVEWPPAAAQHGDWKPAVFTYRRHFVPFDSPTRPYGAGCTLGSGICGCPGYLEDRARGGNWRNWRQCRNCLRILSLAG